MKYTRLILSQHQRQLLDHTYDNKSKKNRVVFSPLTQDDIGSYYLNLSKLQVKQVLLSLISGFNDLHVPVVFFQSH